MRHYLFRPNTGSCKIGRPGKRRWPWRDSGRSSKQPPTDDNSPPPPTLPSFSPANTLVFLGSNDNSVTNVMKLVRLSFCNLLSAVFRDWFWQCWNWCRRRLTVGMCLCAAAITRLSCRRSSTREMPIWRRPLTG